MFSFQLFEFCISIYIGSNSIRLVVIQRQSKRDLDWQTCGQRLSSVAESKRRAPVIYFSVRIRYVFLILNCRRETDLGVCITSVLAKRMRLCIGEFRFKNVFWPQNSSEVGTAQPHSFGNYRNRAQTWICLSSTFPNV